VDVGVSDIIFYLILLALIFMFVRPGSPAAGAIQALSNAAAGVIGAATGATMGEA